MKIGRKYGEKEKIQILIKPLIFHTLRIYIFSFYAFLFFVSLADAECSFPHAEISKYIPQNFLRAYLPDDFPEMIQRLAKVLRDQVRRQRRHLQPVADVQGAGRDQCREQRVQHPLRLSVREPPRLQVGRLAGGRDQVIAHRAVRVLDPG